MTTKLTRRSALGMAAASVAVAGALPTAAASEDLQIESLIGQLREACAHLELIVARTHDALGQIPAAIREAPDAYSYPALAPQNVQDAYERHYVACGARELDQECDDCKRR